MKKKPPQITASNKITSVGKEIDLLSNVTAKDSDNKDISKYVLITKNDVDFNKAGDYKVTYSVLDEEGLRADKDIVVTVKEATKKANTAPKINASDKTTTVGKQLNLLDGVTASDEEDGNLTRYVIISSNNVNFNKVGDYHVTYAVLDSGGIRTEKKITVKVKEKANEAPVIHASDKTITVGNKVNLLSGVKATDKEDGDLTQYVTIASSNVDFDRVGTYKVTYAVLDRGGITTRKQITVTVKSPNNNTAPVIHASDKTITAGNRVNLLSGVKATDKEDGDLTQYVTIASSNVDFDRVGTYKVTYAVLDRGGITTRKQITVTVKSPNNNTAPVIHASDKTIAVGNRVNLLSGVSATDKEDGDLTQYVTIYSSNVDFDRLGTYKVTYAVLDRGGITTYKHVTVTVK